MKVTSRDLVILGVFSALLCAACWVVLVRLNSGSGEPPLAATPAAGKTARQTQPGTTTSRGGTDGRVASGSFVSTLAAGDIPPQYKLIIDRKLFTPLVTPPAPGGGRPSATPMNLGPIPPIIPPAPPVGQPRTVVPPKPPTQTVLPTPRAERPPLAFTGLMRLGGTKAVIENTRYGTARIMGVGDSAWGYQVSFIDVAGGRVGLSSTTAELSKTIVLQLGDKRRVQPLNSGYSGGEPRGYSKGGGDEEDYG